MMRRLDSREETPRQATVPGHSGTRARKAFRWALLCVTLAGCTGYQLLLQLGTTADRYFNSWSFVEDLHQVADFTGKLLGSVGG